MAAFTSSAGTWQWMNPKPQGNNLLCACRVPGTATIYTAGSHGIVLRSDDSGSSWTHIPVDAGGGDITHIQFINGSVGYILLGGRILKTSNVGQTWNTCVPNFSGTISSFSFLNEQFGVLVGTGGMIAITNDSCKTWRIKSTGLTTDLFAVQILNKTTYCLTGKAGLFLKTTDSCQTWFTSYGYWDDNTAIGLHFISLDTGCYWGWTGLLVTHDGGKTWMHKGGSGFFDMYDVALYDADHAYVVGLAPNSTGAVTDIPSEGYWSKDSNIKVQNTPVYMNAVVTVGPNTVVAVGQDGTIMKSTNYGSTWQKVYTYVTYQDLYGIFFSSPSSGWAVGDSGTVLKTTDGGLNWTQMKSPTSGRLTDVCFLNKDTGWLVGPDVNLFKTTDGGSTWAVDNSVSGSTIYFVNDTLGFIGSYESVFRTTDAKTWSRINFNSGVTISKVYFKNVNRGWAGGYNPGIGYYGFYNTTDKGQTWTYIGSSYFYGLQTMQFIDSLHGWGTMLDGTFIKTTDGGKSWQSASYSINSGIGLYFVGIDTGIAISIYGIGTISTDSGKTWYNQNTNIGKTMIKMCDYYGKLWLVGSRGSILSYDFGKNLSPRPVPNAGTDRKVCEGDSVYLGTDSIAGHSYEWISAPAGFHSSISKPVIKADKTTKYFINETIRASGQSASDSVFVTVDTLPVSDWNIIKNSNGYMFYAYDSLEKAYKWYFGDGDSSTGFKTYHNYSANGTYQAKLFVISGNGCISEKDSSLKGMLCINESQSGINTNLEAYPNPVSKDLHIRFSLNESASVRLNILDIYGRSFGTFDLGGHLQSGNHEIIMNSVFQNLPAGIYYLQMISDDQTSGYLMITKQ